MNARIGLVLGALLLAEPSCSKSEAAPEESVAKAPPVLAATVEEIQPTAHSRHMVLAQPNRRSRLSARAGGEIRALEVEEQARVAEGDVLVRLAADDAKGMLMSARGGLKSAKEQLADAKRQLARTKKLHARGAATDRELEQLESMVVTLRAGIDQAQGSLVQAKDRADASVVKAPFAGVVTSIDVEVGEYLGPGQPVLTISELSKLAVEVPLSEREVQLHDKGGLRFVVVVRGEPREATLEWVAREAEAQTSTFTARLSVDNPEALFRAGESVDVQIEGDAKVSRLVVPSSAVRWEGQNAYVLRIDGDKVTRVAVKVGEGYEGSVALEGEVSAGDVVVASGTSTLADGDRVSVTEK